MHIASKPNCNYNNDASYFLPLKFVAFCKLITSIAIKASSKQYFLKKIFALFLQQHLDACKVVSRQVGINDPPSASQASAKY